MAKGDEGNITVSNTSVGCAVTLNDGQINMDGTWGPAGATISTSQRYTTLTNGIYSGIIGQDNILSIGGNSATASSGAKEDVAAEIKHTADTQNLHHGGGVRAANQMAAKSVAINAVAGTKPDGDEDGSGFTGRIKKSLGNVLDSIKKSTESIDSDTVKPYKPTGQFARDLMGQLNWYWEMMVQFVKRNLIKRTIQAIKSEVEKIKAQVNEYSKIKDEWVKNIKQGKLNSMGNSVKAAMESPSDQHKEKKNTITKGDVVKTVPTNEDRANLVEAERNS